MRCASFAGTKNCGGETPVVERFAFTTGQEARAGREFIFPNPLSFPPRPSGKVLIKIRSPDFRQKRFGFYPKGTAMFKFFKKNKKEPENLKEVLKYLKELGKEVKDLTQDLESFKKKSRTNLQKVGIVRFNPFQGVGGNQSFSIALLDENNDGIVLTSQYLQEFNRVYAKPIKGGCSSYSLSKEEKEAIEKAVQGPNS